MLGAQISVLNKRCRIYLSEKNYRRVEKKTGQHQSISGWVNAALLRHAIMMQELKTGLYRKFDATEINAFCVVFGKVGVRVDDHNPGRCVVQFAEQFLRDIGYHPELQFSSRQAFKAADVLTHHTSYAELMALIDLIEDARGSVTCLE